MIAYIEVKDFSARMMDNKEHIQTNLYGLFMNKTVSAVERMRGVSIIPLMPWALIFMGCLIRLG